MLGNNLCLSEIGIGKKAIVKKVNSNENIKRRLLELGLTKGTNVECVLCSPGKDMQAYLIKGALIAIRNEDSNMIDVKLIKEENS